MRNTTIVTSSERRSKVGRRDNGAEEKGGEATRIQEGGEGRP